MTDPLAPGSVIGVLGGGQLGRMLSVAAARLGYRTHIFEPGAQPPASDVAYHLTHAPYEDTDALLNFAADVDVVTYEFENVPASALDVLERVRPIRPGRKALEISQDRLTEKTFLSDLGLAVAPYAQVDDAEDLLTAVDELGLPAILKTRRLGYDGKGQALIRNAGDLDDAFATMAGAPAILEGFVTFDREVSVIAARGQDGAVACYDPGENLHEGGILRRTTVPAPLPPSLRSDAVLMAAKLMNALDYVGVLGLELFVTRQGLLVNEFAPRVHNSGHWTQQGCVVDQFEQHIRAVAGWPLGDGGRFADVVMENLIGDDVLRAAEIAQDPNAALHLYGKAEVKPGRKMGHVNRVVPR